MPSVAQKRSKNALAVEQKHQDLQEKFQASADGVQDLLQVALDQLLPSLSDQLDLQEEGTLRVRAFLEDQTTLFRFYRRARYDQQQALSLLNTSLLWRIKTDLDLLSLSSLHPLYVTPPSPNPPLFWVNSNFKDRFGRPCGVINLRSVERTNENSLEELKEYIVACMEIMRRFISDLNAKLDHDRHVSKSVADETRHIVQSVIAVDLAGSGMANLELELLPFLLDLLKNHFPGMVGAVYILHYGWVHAGMWAVAKRVLPEQALARIFFPSHEELQEHFDVSRIPKAYDGELDVEMNASSNDVLRKWGKPRRAVSSARASPLVSPDVTRSHRSLSRSNSFESIYEVFYSASGTPWASRPITPRHSGPPTPRGDQVAASSGLRMTPSAARKLRRLQMTQGELSATAETSEAGRLRRSASDLRVEDPAAAGLIVNTAGLSPAVTPFGVGSPAVRGRRGDERHVHFGSSDHRHSFSPVRRVGASKSFTLQPLEDDQLPSDTESEASGKDGAKPPLSPSRVELDPVDAKAGGLLSRWRKGRRSSFLSAAEDSTVAEGGHQGAEEPPIDASVTYIDPGSPQLQVPLLVEAPIFQATVPQHRFLSQRSRKYEGRAGHVSPYNANNPFFGYPAYIDGVEGLASSGDGRQRFQLRTISSTPQHLHARRRKRDLMRTLTYLFVLRLLAFHRRLRWNAIALWREVARTMSIAREDQTEDDKFWRLAEEKHRTHRAATRDGDVRRQPASAFLRSRLLYVLLLVSLLKPSWRHSVMAQVSASLSSMSFARLNRTDADEPSHGSPPPQEIRRALVAAPVDAASHSWTGFHLREKFGVKAKEVSAGGNAGGRNSRSRTNPLILAGGALALASLGIYLYSQLGKRRSSGDGDDGDDDPNRRRDSQNPIASGPKVPAKNAKRPSMSLTLSPGFDRTSPEEIEGLKSLLAVLSPVYLIHLILPTSPLGQDHDNDEMEDSITSIVASLGDLPDFDARRVLEYSRNSGRWAIPRALACDCHFEITLPSQSSPDEGGEDAGLALSELDRIRRSSGLVVVAALSSRGEIDDAQIDGIFAGLRERAQQQGGAASTKLDAPAGMRAFDRRQLGQEGWSIVADEVVGLRESWK